MTQIFLDRLLVCGAIKQNVFYDMIIMNYTYRFKLVIYRIHYLTSGQNRIRIFFQINIRPEPDPDLFLIYYPAGTGSGSFFEFTIRPEPDPDLMRSGRIRNRIRIFKYFKFYVFSLEKKLIKLKHYNTIN